MMLKCEGYKMFYGTALITCQNGRVYRERGTWLYRPDLEMWFVTPNKLHPLGTSYPPDMVSDFVEDTAWMR